MQNITIYPKYKHLSSCTILPRRTTTAAIKEHQVENAIGNIREPGNAGLQEETHPRRREGGVCDKANDVTGENSSQPRQQHNELAYFKIPQTPALCEGRHALTTSSGWNYNMYREPYASSKIFRVSQLKNVTIVETYVRSRAKVSVKRKRCQRLPRRR